MAESVSANAVWQYDYIDHYRLDEKIIGGFLSEKWGKSYRYYVKARGCHAAPSASTLTWRSARAMSLDSGCHEPLIRLASINSLREIRLLILILLGSLLG